MSYDRLRIIKEYLSEMATQDRRGTADVFYYTIIDTHEVTCAEEAADRAKYYCNDTSYPTRDEAEAENPDEDIVKYWVRDEDKHQGMFLTESDAKDHILSNRHHYSDKARTYVNHAWRAPKMLNFFNALFEHFEIERTNR